MNGRINKDADIKNRLDNIPPELLLLMALTNPDSYKKRTSEEDLQDVLSDLGIKLQEDDNPKGLLCSGESFFAKNIKDNAFVAIVEKIKKVGNKNQNKPFKP